MTRVERWKVLPGSDESTAAVSVTLVTEIRRDQVSEMMLDLHTATDSRCIDEALLRKLAGLPSAEDSGEVMKLWRPTNAG